MSDKKRGLLKKTIIRQKAVVEREIERLEQLIKNYKNVDYKVAFTRLSCLQSHNHDLDELIAICVDRNKF